MFNREQEGNCIVYFTDENEEPQFQNKKPTNVCSVCKGEGKLYPNPRMKEKFIPCWVCAPIDYNS